MFEVIFYLVGAFILVMFMAGWKEMAASIIASFIENPLLSILKSIPVLLILVYIVATIKDIKGKNKK